MVNLYSPMDCLQGTRDCLQGTRVLLTTQWYLDINTIAMISDHSELHWHSIIIMIHAYWLLPIEYLEVPWQFCSPILIGLNPVYRYIVCYKFSLD